MSRRHSRSFRSLLCAVDFSAASKSALRCAAALAADADAVLTVVYVEDPLLVAATAALHARPLASRTGVQLERFVASTLRGSGGGCRTSVEIGSPAESILRMASQTGADLVVIGASGKGGARRLLGSTASALVRRARLPVLACPARWPHR